MPEEARIEDPNGLKSYFKVVHNYNSLKNLEAAIGQEAESLSADKNMGLATTLLKKAGQDKIRKLGDIYLTLSFAEIADKA